MKIAVPVFRGRISPVFDWATRLLVVETDSDCETCREVRTLQEAQLAARAIRLAEMGVDVLLCGGISGSMRSLVEIRGVRVVPWIAGEVEEVLKAFLAGSIPEKFAMPGCCGKRFRRRIMGRNPGGRHGRRGRGRDSPSR